MQDGWRSTKFQRVHFLQHGHVEKCKTWRIRSVTDFPAVRHVLLIMHRSKEHPYSITLSIARHLPMMPGS